MSIWLVVAATLILGVVWIVRPLLFRNRIELDESEHAVSIFREGVGSVVSGKLSSAFLALSSDINPDECV